MLLCIEFSPFNLIVRSSVRLSVRTYVINRCATLCVKFSHLFLFSRKLNSNSCFVLSTTTRIMLLI